ncbi:hypothetical protein F2Q69_00024565 [Brassica cretica]|uniref:Uncharacterized protein n=1 Tax=Brassica cretica TaxID=69181 RepID=A0A8S9QMS8_BRACR|nr:hypothetical protein F2Q69_00024565 [Brassica cretica]
MAAATGEEVQDCQVLLVTEKGSEPACHASAVCCFLAASEILGESKKACLSFCLSPPVTRAPPMWGVMKHLSQKIPEIAFKKSQMYGYLLSLLTSTREEIMRSSRDQFVMFINDCPKTVAGAKGDCVPKEGLHEYIHHLVE